MSIYTTYSDEELTALLKQEDHVAFTELYNRYWRKLFVVAANKLKDNAAAEELAQDIFVDIWHRRSTITIQTTFRAYLAVALKYKIIDLMAKANHRYMYEEHLSQTNTLVDDYTQQWLSFEELQSRLAHLVNELPEKCKIVYQLREEGFSYVQIATRLGIAERTVESHLNKAIKTIRSKIKMYLFCWFL